MSDLSSHHGKCPVCSSAGEVVQELTSAEIREDLALYYHQPVPDAVAFPNYSILRCQRCTLEYASPMTPGTGEFYTWISGLPGYYPGNRWEWSEVIAEVKAASSLSPTVLEIGCGSGSFLRMLNASSGRIRAIGIDPTANAVEDCRAAGIEAYCETLEQYIANPKHAAKRFDFICSFHCLEHVPDPRGLFHDLLPLASDRSVIFFSTPYSPMSFETRYHDPLNYPPHHMSRWNANAYTELAKQFGLQVQLIGPPALGVLSRSILAVDLGVHGPSGSRSRRLGTILSRPAAVLSEMRSQAVREQLNGRTAPDVVLARFEPSC